MQLRESQEALCVLGAQATDVVYLDDEDDVDLAEVLTMRRAYELLAPTAVHRVARGGGGGEAAGATAGETGAGGGRQLEDTAATSFPAERAMRRWELGLRFPPRRPPCARGSRLADEL